MTWYERYLIKEAGLSGMLRHMEEGLHAAKQTRAGQWAQKNVPTFTRAVDKTSKNVVNVAGAASRAISPRKPPPRIIVDDEIDLTKWKPS